MAVARADRPAGRDAAESRRCQRTGSLHRAHRRAPARAGLDRAFDVRSDRSPEKRLRNLTGLSGFSCPSLPVETPFDPHTPICRSTNWSPRQSRLGPDAVCGRSRGTGRGRAPADRQAGLGSLPRACSTPPAAAITGHEFSPALRMTVPIFNRNQGGIARAEAELEQLDRRRQTVHNQIVHGRADRICPVPAGPHRTRLPAPQDTAGGGSHDPAGPRRRTKKGSVTYLLVLESNRQLIDTYAREAQLIADLRRCWAELERARRPQG